MITVNVGGVPEHFNLAWYLALKSKEFKTEGINLRWHDYFGGTGEMCNGLRQNDIDIAVILTEGIVKDITNGNPSKIVQTFVESPLVWGIHVAANSPFKTIDDIKGSRAAISRFGSGSHLMAYINAENHNWDINTDLNFEVINNLSGAVEGLTQGNADYFMWEKFTTKPLVDNGTFRRIADCPTPWPCFVIAVTDNFISNHKEELKTILDIVNNTTIDFKSIPSIDKTIANRYEQNLNDVQQWLAITEWSQSLITEPTLTAVQKKLMQLNIIDTKLPYKNLTQPI